MPIKQFELRQGFSFDESHHITYLSGIPSEFHNKMVKIMEETMCIPKSYYMRSWYHDNKQKIRIYDYGSHLDFFYLVELENTNDGQD